jgi:hypothetical protein
VTQLYFIVNSHNVMLPKGFGWENQETHVKVGQASYYNRKAVSELNSHRFREDY